MGWKEGLWSVSMRCIWFLRIYSLSSSLNVVSAGTPMRPPSSSELSSSSGAKRRTDLRPVFEDEDATLDAEDGPVSEGFVGEVGLDMARWGERECGRAMKSGGRDALVRNKPVISGRK